MFSVRPFVRLEKVPHIALRHKHMASAAEAAQIRAMIQSLSIIERVGPDISNEYASLPDFGAFPPVPGYVPRHRGVYPLIFNRTIQKIVSFGSKAIPFLLEALGEKTNTKVAFRKAYVVDHNLPWNPFHQREDAVWSDYKVPFSILFPDFELPDVPPSSQTFPYTLTIGDFCFDALGKIVGRDYSFLLPLKETTITSPSSSKKLAAGLRAVWTSKDSDYEQMLLDSLLIDFSTRGRANGISGGRTDVGMGSGSWEIGSNFQTEAAIRLLYYFPDVAIPLIVHRLDHLNVNAAERDEYGPRWMKRELGNGVEVVKFIRAVYWHSDSRIQSALKRIRARTKDEEIMKALSEKRQLQR